MDALAGKKASGEPIIYSTKLLLVRARMSGRETLALR